MTSLILATSELASYRLRQAGRADIVVGLRPRFVWGKMPSSDDLTTLLEPRSAKHVDFDTHWLDFASSRWTGSIGRDIGLVELCERCDSVELWADPQPNDQLVLAWLLDVLRPHRHIVAKLKLVQTDVEIGRYRGESLAKWRLPALAVTDDRLELAGRAWTAYRAPTPEPCFDLLMQDLSAIPQLRAALIALLEELPGQDTGLGASELRMLDLVADGETSPQVLSSELNRERGVFDFQEAELILDRLAYCPSPVLTGFPAEIEAPDDLKARNNRLLHSRLSLTDFGQEVSDRELDFSQYNTIHRWWGGTELTNERLWRWDAESRALVAP
ncbi:hypothetical protein ACVIHI_003771 [Bradyrhizobium sp. USDA 4524]|uniref:hypothetical protein n=1 Tax=Bradyrhizobium TaxID=374 RepID=UPI0020A1A61D|nr:MULTISPECIES: hypothetical protein [Bradyrhizobium]MCP1843310.1 hypothetical protein [Bradyrhizobium sp. USDA 4538]MCP1903876.1 hypothetical protein [Bradyrhizobium sp. USDA 4537]MCP1990468.1 hypothetical protein [Bradyrhizobium sp. USDA 4539]MCP3419913.1 hypothetical protein [Bradyrhizobium brasilense]